MVLAESPGQTLRVSGENFSSYYNAVGHGGQDGGLLRCRFGEGDAAPTTPARRAPDREGVDCPVAERVLGRVPVYLVVDERHEILALPVLDYVTAPLTAAVTPQTFVEGSRKGGQYGWKPTSSSSFSIRALRAFSLTEIRQTILYRAI